MKNFISFITLLIFILSITDHVMSKGTIKSTTDAVIDAEGNELIAGRRYLLLSFLRPEGGVSLYAMPNQTCTYAVAQQIISSGLPVTILPSNSSAGDVVHENTDLNIMFSPSFGCSPSPVWKIGDYDESTKQYFVMTGGSMGKDQNETFGSLFQIRKAEFGYSLVFCLRNCDSCAPMCSAIGRLVQDGSRRLVLGGDSSFIFSFARL